MSQDLHFSLAPDNLQSVLDSAANAAQKGTAQWSTPPELAARLAEALPPSRPQVADLTCGRGSLLAAAGNHTTRVGYGIDIDTRPGRPKLDAWAQERQIHRITGDLQDVVPLLAAIGWKCPLFVLNPPWDLHWFKGRWRGLPGEAGQFLEPWMDCVDPRLGPEKIDSCLATWLAALAFSPREGEGLTLWNAATWRRLVDSPDAPWKDLQPYVWATLSFPHWSAKTVECTAVWWSLDHYRRRRPDLRIPSLPSDLGLLDLPSRSPEWDRWCLRILNFHDEENWLAVLAELVRRQRSAPDWNLWLAKDGTIATDLTTYQRLAAQIPSDKAAMLHALRGRHPLDLMLRREERDALRAELACDLWRVAPAMRQACDAALAQYQTARAPIIAMPAVQRLGFLDEHDHILCARNWSGFAVAGQSYKLTSRTIRVERSGTRLTMAGEIEPALYVGSELVLTVLGESGERHFVDPRLLAGDVVSQDIDLAAACSLTDLLHHFDVPDVQDLGQMHSRALADAEEKIARLESELSAIL